MIRIAIVEDNQTDYENLNEYLLRFSRENNVFFDIKHFSDAVDFVSDYKFEFDVIFMDIMLPDLNGMNAVKKLREIDESVVIIFVTSMPQYAIEGYSVNALYYVLKPLGWADFSVKMENVLKHVETELNGEFLFLEPPFEKRKVSTKEIKYIEVFAHDVIFHLYNEDIHVRGTLLEYEKQLNPQRFCRINACYLVNLNFVTAVKDMSVFIGETELRMSFTRKKQLMKALADFAGAGQ